MAAHRFGEFGMEMITDQRADGQTAAHGACGTDEGGAHLCTDGNANGKESVPEREENYDKKYIPGWIFADVELVELFVRFILPVPIAKRCISLYSL